MSFYDILGYGDTYWGCVNGVGENHLGKTLMDIREVLKNLVNVSETMRSDDNIPVIPFQETLFDIDDMVE